ncbi:M20/M25/M40 family metallo-hydrolase [Myxococcota bacterium]|nr:M20/M25/M40 family metallo-hydrolase [Myxococcota bacterium]
MIRPLFLLLLLLATAACGRQEKKSDPPASPGQEMAAGITEAALLAHVNHMTAKELAGRKIGSPGEKAAAAYVEKHLKAAGFTPVGDAMIVPVLRPGLTGTLNVVGVKRGPSDRVVLVGAHLDHLGERDGKLHPGADDNASGVAALLEICRELSTLPLKKTLVCVAFGGEEAGLVGSRAFVRDATVDPAKIDRMVNLDMLGHPLFESMFGQSKPDGLGVIVNRIPEAELDGIIALAKAQGVEIMSLPEIWIQKLQPGFAYDSMPFNEKDVATLFFSSGLHADYHRPTDTVDRLAPRQLRNRAVAITKIVAHLAQ